MQRLGHLCILLAAQKQHGQCSDGSAFSWMLWWTAAASRLLAQAQKEGREMLFFCLFVVRLGFSCGGHIHMSVAPRPPLWKVPSFLSVSPTWCWSQTHVHAAAVFYHCSSSSGGKCPTVLHNVSFVWCDVFSTCYIISTECTIAQEQLSDIDFTCRYRLLLQAVTSHRNLVFSLVLSQSSFSGTTNQGYLWFNPWNRSNS